MSTDYLKTAPFDVPIIGKKSEQLKKTTHFEAFLQFLLGVHFFVENHHGLLFRGVVGLSHSPRFQENMFGLAPFSGAQRVGGVVREGRGNSAVTGREQ